MSTFLNGRYFFRMLIASYFFIFYLGIANSKAEVSAVNVPTYAGTLEHLYTTKEKAALEIPLLYLLEGLEVWGSWLSPSNEVGLLPEAEGRFMVSNTPILQTGVVPGGIGVVGFAQPIIISHDGIPLGFNDKEYLYEQPLLNHDASVEDVFQRVPYLDRLNYQYGIEMAGLTAKVYRKPIELEFTLFVMLQKIGAPPEIAEAWVEEYAKLAYLPQTIQLSWLIAGNPLTEAYQSHVQSVLEPLNLSTLQINSIQGTEWVNQDPFWEEIQKQPLMKAFTDLLSNANEEIKRSFIVALFLLEPTSQITGSTSDSDNFTLRSNHFLLSSQENTDLPASIGPSFAEEAARIAFEEGSKPRVPSYHQNLSEESSDDDLKTSSEAGHPNIQIIPKEQQVRNILLGGTVYENRPISFPAYGKTKAYSNLFAWSNIEAKEDEEVNLHLHKGFEVMTFVLEGVLVLNNEDANTEKWTPIPAGGVQFIKTGDGVQHAERYAKGSRTLQIWFDPDFSKSSNHKATYQNYQANSFTETSANAIKTMVYVGDGSPIQSETEGLSIKKLTFSNAEHKLELDLSKVYSMYVLDGEVTFDGQQASKDDYIIIQSMESVNLAASKQTQLFIVETPRRPSYTTYAESNKEH